MLSVRRGRWNSAPRPGGCRRGAAGDTVRSRRRGRETMMDRRLTVILAADLAGYSRLMAADEEGVIERLRAARAEVIDPALAEAGGRIVKTMGDGLLVEFGSPVAAVRAALVGQRAMAVRETEPAAERLTFRVGINLGD